MLNAANNSNMGLYLEFLFKLIHIGIRYKRNWFQTSTAHIPLVQNKAQQYLILVLYCIMFCHETNNAPPTLRIPIHYSFVNVCQVLVTRPPTIRIHVRILVGLRM